MQVKRWPLERSRKMTKSKKKKDSLDWLEELVEAAKAWRASFGSISDDHTVGAYGANARALATAVDGYRQAIKDEVEAEMAEEEKKET